MTMTLEEATKRFPLIPRGLTLIRLAHKGQLYNGLPYWHHPIRVMLRFNWLLIEAADIYAAFFHDLFEDTDVRPDDLRNLGYSEQTIEIVRNVTRNKEEETYKEFITRIVATKSAKTLRLKLADLYENSNNLRFLPEEKKTLMIRYGKSIQDIEDAFKGITNDRNMYYPVISGELNRDEVKQWIGEQPLFL